ncbi:hypothetical protein ILYODFUR_034760 [Ilyodon furcidens]|uniref:Uncharacterized protein n=1 Tax=Ilyodon furcidens TaxID=33524 RepID=A0ABV0T5D8_9TELE
MMSGHLMVLRFIQSIPIIPLRHINPFSAILSTCNKKCLTANSLCVPYLELIHHSQMTQSIRKLSGRLRFHTSRVGGTIDLFSVQQKFKWIILVDNFNIYSGLSSELQKIRISIKIKDKQIFKF